MAVGSRSTSSGLKVGRKEFQAKPDIANPLLTVPARPEAQRRWLLSRPRRGNFSRITTLFGTAVEAARSSEGIFTSFLLLSLFYVGECPVDAQFLRKRVGSIMKLDQKSKVKVLFISFPRAEVVFILYFLFFMILKKQS